MCQGKNEGSWCYIVVPSFGQKLKERTMGLWPILERLLKVGACWRPPLEKLGKSGSVHGDEFRIMIHRLDANWMAWVLLYIVVWVMPTLHSFHEGAVLQRSCPLHAYYLFRTNGPNLLEFLNSALTNITLTYETSPTRNVLQRRSLVLHFSTKRNKRGCNVQYLLYSLLDAYLLVRTRPRARDKRTQKLRGSWQISWFV